MLVSVLLLWPAAAWCGNSATMYSREYNRFGTLVQTDTQLTVEKNGKLDVMLLIAAGPGGKGAVSAASFTLERMKNGLRFQFFNSDHTNIGATQIFECNTVSGTSATWNENRELVTEGGHGSEVAKYTATLDAAGDLHIKIHSERTIRRLLGLAHSKSSADYEVLCHPRQ